MNNEITIESTLSQTEKKPSIISTNKKNWILSYNCYFYPFIGVGWGGRPYPDYLNQASRILTLQ